MVEPMNEALRVVCFKNAEEIAAYVREDPKRINLWSSRKTCPPGSATASGPGGR
ncbi:hypothetical protein [uncultured Desulfosarcina sp.]|uniref:hypothetical protein n=1 Tax=uncultured Desulfosarcina sp. TaxID=218289 RepID=UPI0029C8648A|nr:hypothetical protein [uncultured Desulfosarcina sp.]